MSEKFIVALKQPERVAELLNAIKRGDTNFFSSPNDPSCTSDVLAVLSRVQMSPKKIQHGFVSYPGGLSVRIPAGSSVMILKYFATVLHALYRVSKNTAFPWIFTIGHGSDETNLVITMGEWKLMNHTECAEGNYRPHCPERNMVHKFTTAEKEMECPIKKLPQVTALSGPPNTNKTKLAVWLAKNIGKSKHILLIDSTQGAGHYPGVSVWSDVHITKKKLTAMLSLYANDGHGWTVIIDSMTDLDLGAPSDSTGLDNAIKIRMICASLKRMAKSLPIKFILISHENSWHQKSAKADYTLTDVWVRTTTAHDNTVTFTVSSEKDGPSEPFTQVLP